MFFFFVLFKFNTNRFHKVSIISALQCAGNRAKHMINDENNNLKDSLFGAIDVGMMGNAQVQIYLLVLIDLSGLDID